MSGITTYNPQKIQMALGSHIASGFGEDSFLTVESLSEGITSTTGADGEMVRNIDPRTQTIIKVNLLYGSKTHIFLNDMYKRDLKEADGMFPILIKDIMQGMTISADLAWAVKPPSHEYGKAAGEREWEIHTGPTTTDYD